MALLTVCLDQVAVLRGTQQVREPDPSQAAVVAELAGADGISVRLRRDRKYIRDRDLYMLREIVKSRLTVEIPPTEEIITKALDVKPSVVTFVADHADPSVPVSGIDFNSAPVDFSDLSVRFKGVGVGVCFLIEPEVDSVKGAVRAGADAVLINCGGFTHAQTLDQAQQELDRIDRTAQAAAKSDVTVAAGRGINNKNILALHELALFDEFYVGHSILARAMLSGMDVAVKETLDLVRYSRSSA